MDLRYVWVDSKGKPHVSTKPQFANDHYVPMSIWSDCSNIRRYCSKVDRILSLLEAMVLPK